MIKKAPCTLVLAALAAALIPATAAAQNATPGGANKLRFFGGFSYLRFTATGNDEVLMIREDTFGLRGSVTYYVHPKVGIMFDAGFNTGSVLPFGAPAEIEAADLTLTSWLLGPSFVISQDERVLVQGFAAFGAVAGSIDVRATSAEGLAVFERFGDTAFATSIGAAFDLTINDDWAFRVAQLEVLIMPYDETLTNFRYGGGIVGTF